MNRTKYDGKLTDSLIQTVIDAERRLWAAADPGFSDAPTGLLGGKTTPCERLAREYPTPTERREAWIRNNGPDDE